MKGRSRHFRSARLVPLLATLESHKARELSNVPNWAPVNKRLEDKAYNASRLMFFTTTKDHPHADFTVTVKTVKNTKKKGRA